MTSPAGQLASGAADPTRPATDANPAAQAPVARLLDLVLEHECYIGRGALLSACTPAERVALAVAYGARAGVPAHAALDRMYLWITGWRTHRLKLLGYGGVL